MKCRENMLVMFSAGVAFVAGTTSNAGVVEFLDRDAWFAAVGEFTTIDFVGFEPGTIITDQYADFGVLFTDGNDRIPPFGAGTFLNDGWGLDGNGNIRLAFSEPQAWIAADFPGFLRIQLFKDDLLIFSSGEFGQGGIGNFGGLISSELFDSAVLRDFPANFEAEIDDLHFGVPSPSVIAFLVLGGLRGRRRRDSCSRSAG